MDSKKHNGYCDGYCGVIRKRDFEDKHPVMAAMLALGGIVVLFILMVII